MSENKNISKDLKKPNNISDNIMNKKGKKISRKQIGGDFVEIFIMYMYFFQLEENIHDLLKLEKI